ncbi:NAD(P)/FAD-dependent oxidoreductase [Paenibacillus sp. PR3]|uniref:NAD(P)/FAD-dependent oxidoreductase n=1 Tax=Paenibacillus terricola TaxID=2763503 RepID=A0ABR8N2R9_9BACL|nr:NAD(P)/FAD-dependent oxidoreductase [Paenibacillus terricola]MBD3922458.1 NAD(P)/FAD-dependent oxidoreductase [Paenibacillus terricola]
MADQVVDVVIAGGGPAGLSAALVLGRSLRRVVLIDEGKPRNAVTRRSHGFLTRDGTEPEQLRMLAREELRRYETVDLRHDTVVSAERAAGGFFQSHTKEGLRVTSRMLVFATGMKEKLPEWPGLLDVYGRSVFPCPYCDGWELRDAPLALLGSCKSKLLAHVQLIRTWSRDLVVCTDGPAGLSAEEKEQLHERGIALYEQPIAALASSDGQLTHIELEDGQHIARTGAFLTDTGAHEATDIPRQLGVGMEPRGVYQTGNHGLTRIPGLYIIGDAKHAFTGVAGAVSEGYEAGVAINHALAIEDW